MEDDVGLKLRKLQPSRLQLVAQSRINNMFCAVLHPLTPPNYPDQSYSLSDPHAAHSHS